MGMKKRAGLASVLLVALVFAVYWPLGHAGFVSFDDPGYTSGNHHLRAGLTFEGARWALTAFHMSNWHPLTLLSHMLDTQLFGSEPRGPHLVNVMLHALNAVLVLGVLRSLTGTLGPACFVAALFAFHPLHVESVAWVSERKDVLSTFFWLLGLAAYVRHVRRPSGWRSLLVLLCLVAGLAAKPMLVTFPFTLLILDFWPLGRFRTRLQTASCDDFAYAGAIRVLAEKLPLFFLALLSAALTLQAQSAGGSVKSGVFFALGSRLANAVVAPAFYLAKLCVPVGLSVFYPHPLRVDVVATTWAALLIAVITGAVLLCLRRRPWLAAGWTWYLATLAPVLGVIQVGLQAAADRYTYVPLLGIFLALVWEMADRVRRHRRAALAAGAFGVAVLSILMLLTRGQLAVWRDTFSLFGHALRVDPDNWLAHNSLGVALVSDGRTEQAIPHYREAIRLNPAYALPFNNLAVVLMQRDELGAAIALAREAVRLNPGYVDALYNLGNAYRRAGLATQATESFRAALARDPDHIRARNNLARILIDEHRLDEALAELRAAERIDPGYIYTLNNLGAVLKLQGQLTDAETYLRQVVARDPGFPGAALALADLLARTGRSAEARSLIGGPPP